MDLLPKPKITDRVKIYVKQHWRELVLAVVFAGAAGVAGYTLFLQHIFYDHPGSTTVVAHKTNPNLVPSPLTGLLVPIDQADNQVLGVMVENLAGPGGARPQSGLSQAGVVFETVAEGGITRYLALFQEARPRVLGPVRSLRPYYLDWAMGFDAVIIHAGGSGQALSLARSRQVKDMNALIYGLPTFYRIGTRIAPHNLYTSGSALEKLAISLGYKTSSFTPYARTNKDHPATTPTATVINISYSGPDYAVKFKYDKSSDTYKRYLAGQPDIDHTNHKQIAVKNLVVVTMPVHYSGEYAVMPTVGSGKVVVFRDGVTYKGTWSKASPSSQLRLLDSSGQDILLNRGSTWFAVVPAGRPVTY